VGYLIKKSKDDVYQDNLIYIMLSMVIAFNFLNLAYCHFVGTLQLSHGENDV
jgi:hypothetical protein